MPTFQPLSGPGFKVTKRAGTVADIRAEIERRVGELAGARVTVPPIVPADRGRWSANWRIEDWSGVPTAQRSAVEAIVVAVMREWEVQE